MAMGFFRRIFGLSKAASSSSLSENKDVQVNVPSENNSGIKKKKDPRYEEKMKLAKALKPRNAGGCGAFT
jgi:hypothetical protein